MHECQTTAPFKGIGYDHIKFSSSWFAQHQTTHSEQNIKMCILFTAENAQYVQPEETIASYIHIPFKKHHCNTTSLLFLQDE